MCSEDFAVRFANNYLNEAFAFANGTCLAAGDERHFPDFELEAFLLCSSLSQSHTRDLRVTISATRKNCYFLRPMAGNKKSLDGLDGLETGDAPATAGR